MSVPARIEERRAVIAVAPQWNPEQVAVIKQLVCVGATDAELALFAEVCRKTGLDPFSRQIFGIKRSGKLTIQTSIDGFRLIAERTGKYGGQLGPFWCGPDGDWTEVWLGDQPPAAAKLGVIRTDWQAPLWAVALFREYTQGQGMWTRMPANQLAKCGEALALRRAFPAELSGVYTEDEVAQADRPAADTPPPRPERPAVSVHVSPRTPDRPAYDVAVPATRSTADEDPGASPLPADARSDRTRLMRSLHAAIADAAGRDGSGLGDLAPHDVAHEVGCAAFGVGSLTELTDNQLRGLVERFGRVDAAGVQALRDKAREATAARPPAGNVGGLGIDPDDDRDDGPSGIDPETGEPVRIGGELAGMPAGGGARHHWEDA